MRYVKKRKRERGRGNRACRFEKPTYSRVADGLNGRGTEIFYGAHFQAVAGFRTKVVAPRANFSDFAIRALPWRSILDDRESLEYLRESWTRLSTGRSRTFIFCYCVNNEKWRVKFSYSKRRHKSVTRCTIEWARKSCRKLLYKRYREGNDTEEEKQRGVYSL